MSGKRGAPYGNTNALKHGFYSKHFRDLETSDLEATAFEGLADEVIMLRLVLLRLFYHASSTPNEKLMLSDFKSLSVISNHLSQLLINHRILTGEENPIVQLITRCISEVNEELGISKKR